MQRHKSYNGKAVNHDSQFYLVYKNNVSSKCRCLFPLKVTSLLPHTEQRMQLISKLQILYNGRENHISVENPNG